MWHLRGAMVWSFTRTPMSEPCVRPSHSERKNFPTQNPYNNTDSGEEIVFLYQPEGN